MSRIGLFFRLIVEQVLGIFEDNKVYNLIQEKKECLLDKYSGKQHKR